MLDAPVAVDAAFPLTATPSCGGAHERQLKQAFMPG
jgi:hypothetical protein